MKKRIISALLALSMLVSIHTTAFAVNTAVLPSPASNLLVEARGNFGGYGHRVTSSGSGTFDVVVTGSTLSAGITMSTSSSNPNAWVSFSIEKPDGSYFKSNETLGANAETKYQMILPKAGTYKIHYNAYTGSDTIHIQCWIYG